MDSRRVSRTVIDPKVRQVGFVTPGAPPPPRSKSVPADASVGAVSSSPPVSDLSPASNSLSPVMIPPPRHTSVDGLPLMSRPSSVSVAIPVPAPMSPLRKEGSGQVTAGSYNPSESTAVMSPTISCSSGMCNSEFSEDAPASGLFGKGGSGKVASSFPGSGGEMMAIKASGSNLPASSNLPVMSNLTKVSVVKMPAGVSDKDLLIEKGKGVEVQNERSGGSKLKEKTSKAERRALQEAQRAAKAAAKDGDVGKSTPITASTATANSKQPKGGKPSSQKKEVPQTPSKVSTSEKKEVDRLSGKDRKKDVPHPRMQYDDKSRVEKFKRHAVVNQMEATNRVELFRHLPQYVRGNQLSDLESRFFQLDPMHPSVYKVGLQYLTGNITGGNARCIAMLLAFRDAIADYSTPPEKSLVRDLTAKIGSYVSFLIECRPLSISMGNAIRFLKNRIAKLRVTLSEAEAKMSLVSDIYCFINEKIVTADKVIVEHAVTKISDGDVLLTYGFSCVVEMILLNAYEHGKQFRVVVVDSRPKLEGQILLRKLVAKGISCTYTHVNALSYIMHEVTRVFLGASSVLSNGTVYSRVGTACVAMVAHAFRVPVLICCEAYKFHNRVQLDSICSNELGDPDVISKVHGREDVTYLDNWTAYENLQLLNLMYDATPADYVSMIITDYGMVPPTSVPVIVREYCRDQLWI